MTLDRRARVVLTFATVLAAAVPPAAAAASDAPVLVRPRRPSPWAVTFGPVPADGGSASSPGLARSPDGPLASPWTPNVDGRTASSGAGDDQGSPRGAAFVYSEGYLTRRKVHYAASFATLPLFATQYVLGKKLYDGTGSSGTRTAHQAVAVGVGALFAVNTVTGVWNLVEARQNPNGRAKRTVHAVLMLAADAGFVATAALAPGENGSGDRSAHRTVAITSVAVATTGYLIMLFMR
jgi:hypothetical protein